MARMVGGKAGDLIAAELERQTLNKRALARERVDKEHPDVTGAERRRLIDRYRRALVRWTSEPPEYLSYENAAWIGPRLGIPVADLVRPELTGDERLLREAERLEARARELRGLAGRSQGDEP